MNFRRIPQMAMLCLAICYTTLAQVNPGSSFLFQLPNPGTNTRLLGYLADTTDLNADLDTTTPVNTRRILATPDGQRLYVIADGALQVFTANLQTLQTVNAIAGPIRNAILTPDGKYLLVVAAQFYILDTATNTVVRTNLGVNGVPIDVAVSSDSTKAWLLQTQFNGSTIGSIVPLNLATLTAGTRLDIARTGETITYSPQGKLYVPTQNQITEFDTAPLARARETVMSARPGRLYFNLSGSEAYFIDKEETIGYSIVAFRPTTQQTFGWPANVFTENRPTFDELFLASAERIYALDRLHSTLWEITASPFEAAPVTSLSGLDSSIVYAAAISDELPSARYLYVLSENSGRPTLARISLASSTLQTFSNAQTAAGRLQYIGIPPQTGASQFLKFNDNQVLPTGGAAKTLITYITDSLGRPVYNQPVTFTVDGPSASAVLSNSSTVTSPRGYVETTLTLPNEPGTYTVLLAAGTASTTFTVTVPAPNTGGGGGGGGAVNRMSIVKGDGQLVKQGFATPDWAPLTVKVVNANGDPQPGVAVEFTIVQGEGAVLPHDFNQITTDEDGLVTADYFTAGLNTSVAFYPTLIRATSEYGSVEFTQVVFRLENGNSGVPLISAQSEFSKTVARGDIITDFFTTEIHAALSPQIGDPIPGVGLRIADGEDYHLDGPGRCVNDTKSDNLGVARCDYQVPCTLTGATKIQIMIGELLLNPLFLTPIPGGGQKLAYVSGNNQSGNVGQLLNQRLTALITDNCGDPVANKTVTWTVTQGGASLSQIINKSGADGMVSAAVTLGQTAGTAKVTVTLPNLTPIEFTLTTTVNVSSLTLVSGSGQSVLPGEAFPTPILFQLRTSNGAVAGPNLNVNFSLSGSGTLGSATGTTNALGQVQTTVIAGANPGTITVTATYASFSASATLTTRVPTLPLTPASFSNAASGATGLVPCGLATAVGAGLVPTPGVISGIGAFGPLPYSLGNVDSLRVNNILAPIQAVSNQNGKQQINFQVPCETAPGNATVVVRVNGVDTTVSNVPVYVGQPGIFTYAGPSGKLYGAVLRVKDGSYITPSNYAPTGENFYLILTGLGLVTPNTATNSGGNNQTVNLTTVVGVNNGGVPTQPARYLPGSIGVYYVEFTIPKTSTAAPGTVLLTDTPLAVFVNINGQPVFGNPVLLPGVVQGN